MYSNPYNKEEYKGNCPSPKKFTKSQVRLINKFRMLWEQHDVWTRSTIMSIAFDLPDLDFVIKRLLRNPADFGRVFEIFYGRKIAAKFTRLLRVHLVIAAQIVEAAKAGDEEAVARLERKWYANADQIAAFLARINPFWSEEEWREMMHTHLGLVNAEAVDILKGDYAAGVAIYDKIEKQTLQMADMMAEGIFKQFPEMFKK
jgi:hypothetical protein